MSSLRFSPFEAVEQSFRELGEPPCPLRIRCEAISDGLPPRLASPLEVRALLMHRSVDYPTSNEALGWIVAKAQTDGQRWLLVATGMVMPGIKARTKGLARWCREAGDGLADMEAEALGGVMAATLRMSPLRPKLAANIVWAGFGSARRFVERHMRERAQCTLPCDWRAPVGRSGHADLVLSEARSAGVLDEREEALIGETRLGQERIVSLARSQGRRPEAVRKQRRRAELRLRPWLDERAEG